MSDNWSLDRRTADAILCFLCGRRGFDNWWGDIDEDIAEEIKEGIAAIVKASHVEAT